MLFRPRLSCTVAKCGWDCWFILFWESVLLLYDCLLPLYLARRYDFAFSRLVGREDPVVLFRIAAPAAIYYLLPALFKLMLDRFTTFGAALEGGAVCESCTDCRADGARPCTCIEPLLILAEEEWSLDGDERFACVISSTVDESFVAHVASSC